MGGTLWGAAFNVAFATIYFITDLYFECYIKVAIKPTYLEAFT